ncbi:MAG: hypothetical protein KDB01_17450, partial [Planctomycetaceae bacterium]|nr:hypothetical protein [Planctomycetaceae bacterium]
RCDEPGLSHGNMARQFGSSIDSSINVDRKAALVSRAEGQLVGSSRRSETATLKLKKVAGTVY